MKRLLRTALFGLCAAGLAPPAHASIILSLQDAAPVAVPGGFDYTYLATLSQDQQISPAVRPVFFTLYDFGLATLGARTGSLADPTWAFQLGLDQATPAQGILPNNNPAVADVRATYTGPQANGPSFGSVLGNLGSFTLFTTSTGPFAIVNDNQDAQAEKYAPGSPSDNTATSNLASLAVPTIAVTVAEPASMMLLGAGLMGLGVIRRRTGRA